MVFSIVTPSFRSSRWLPLCIASVADQGVEVEHIVQDSCSDDGTQELLRGDPCVKAFIEKDKGMYDAVNRGLHRARGDVLAYLNADEQYLPEALRLVADYFNAHPDVDVVLSDTVVTDAVGDYVCHRWSLTPGKHQLWVRFPVLSCALFIRRHVIHNLGVYLDPQWRDLGDLFWIMDMVKRRVRFAVLPRYTSVFTDTGGNMGLAPNAVRERGVKWQLAPAWIKPLKLPIILWHRVRLLLRGAPFQRPFDYALYTLASPRQRVTRHAARPTSFWKRQ